MQIGLYDGNKEFINNKPIRLIELFGGIGCQAKALENLNVKFEHYRMCDFDKYAVQSYNAVHGTNFVPSDITKLKAEDLGIVETYKYDYIMTYSFPCQDLSLAGKGMGMAKDCGTRSGLLWEVERLLDECKELPQVLLMENVPQVHGKKNIDNFNEWCLFLESKGYKNYWKDLNAKDFGIPQNRNRTFMVSLLGDYTYEFPKPFELKLRLKDMLESEVDEKYYLSDKGLKGIISTSFQQGKLENRTEKDGIIPTLTARDYKDHKLVLVAKLDGFESSGRVYSPDGLAPTINTMGGGNREPKIAIKKCNIKNIMTDLATTLGTNCGSSTSAGGGVVLEKQKLQTKICNKRGVVVINGIEYFVRKLTPKECWRLMGFRDTDFDKAQKVNSNAQLYKQAGNGIVVNVLMAIFKNLNLKGAL